MGKIILSTTGTCYNVLLKSYDYQHKRGGTVRVYAVVVNASNCQHAVYSTTNGKDALLKYHGMCRILRVHNPEALLTQSVIDARRTAA